MRSGEVLRSDTKGGERLDTTLRYIITLAEQEIVGPALAMLDAVYAADPDDPPFYDPRIRYLVCSHADFDVGPGDLHVTLIIPGLPARADDAR